MTSDAATLLRINKEWGAIVAGLFADIIAMSVDPPGGYTKPAQGRLCRENGIIVRQC